MTGFKRDENRIPVIGAVSSVDSTTLVQLEAEPTEKALHVFIKGTDVATGGTSALDDADFTAGTTPGTPVMGIYESTPTTPTDGDMGVVGITVNREVKTVDTNLITIIKAEDAAHSTGDKGIMVLAVENEDQADLSTGDKDYTPIAVTKEGNVIVKQEGTIAVTESTPLTGFATSAGQLADGHNVTVDNVTGSAVYVQPGTGASFSVDLGTNNDVDLNAGTNVIGKVRLVSASGDELSEDTDDSIQVTIVADDVGIGGGTQYAEDAGHSTGDTGTMALIVRDDVLAANAGTNADLDYMPMRGDNYGATWVTLTDAAGTGVDASAIGGGTEYTEDVATANPQIGKAIMMERDDALSAVTPAEGDWIGLRGNANGALWTIDANSATQTTHLSEIEGAVETIEGMFGTAGSADSQVISVQGIASMTALSVTESSPISGFATSAAQLADGHNVTIDNISTNEVYIRGGGTAGSATDGEVVAVQGIASGTAMAVTESTPLTGFATSALQLADGHNVTIDNASADEVYVRGGGTAGSPTDGEVVVIQGIAGADAVTVALDTTDNAVIDNIALYTAGSETALELIDGAIVGPGEPTIDSYTHLAINLGVVTDSVLVASAASKQIWVYGITYTCSVAGTVSFQDEDNTAITGVMDHAANSGLSHPTSGNFSMPIWKLGTDKDLEVDTVTCSIDGWLDYAIVSV